MGDAPERGLLTLVQWLSPAFPLGSFAYSHGLETAIAAGQVRTAADTEAWLADVLRFGAGRQDAALLRAAMAAPPEAWADLGAEAEALAASAERWIEARDQGRAFCRTVTDVTGWPIPPLPLPVAVGAAASHLGLAPGTVAALYLQSFAANLVSAATRLVPLGQTEAQACLARLAPICETLGAETSDWRHIGNSAFGADLAAMAHETQEVRLFRT